MILYLYSLGVYGAMICLKLNFNMQNGTKHFELAQGNFHVDVYLTLILA